MSAWAEAKWTVDQIEAKLSQQTNNVKKLASSRYDEETQQAISMLPMDYADGTLTIPESLGSNSETDENTVILA